jgi:hypothetical protein
MLRQEHLMSDNSSPAWQCEGLDEIRRKIEAAADNPTELFNALDSVVASPWPYEKVLAAKPQLLSHRFLTTYWSVTAALNFPLTHPAGSRLLLFALPTRPDLWTPTPKDPHTWRPWVSMFPHCGAPLHTAD